MSKPQIEFSLLADGTLILNGKAYGKFAEAHDEAIREIVKALELGNCKVCGCITQTDEHALCLACTPL